ncbi:MAG: hypothetical protein ABI782_05685 [Anaerolineaceae bacterium]
MPEMNGRELADELQSRHPNLKCLFVSGYTADIIARQGVLDEGVSFLEKPFTMRRSSLFETATQPRRSMRSRRRLA